MVILSILIWDTPDYAELLLRNLFEEIPIGDTPHQVYVLDQGSGWRTRRILRRYRDRIRLVRVKQNVGFPEGHNLIFRTARENSPVDAICVINSDVRFLEPKWLDRMVETQALNPKVAITSPAGLNVIREGKRVGHGTPAGEDEIRAGQYDFLSGCVTLIRASVAGDLGLYDPVFTPGYFEDADLCYRYRASGFELAFCPIRFEHGYLGARTSTAKIKKDCLDRTYGDFRERNRQEFLNRWHKELLGREDTACP